MPCELASSIMPQDRRSWVEINIAQLIDNYKIYSQICNCEIMAVVKADAYGHGDNVIAKALQKHGVKHFAVSNINEAINLREAGIKGQILILEFTPGSCAALLMKYDITQTIVSDEHIQAFYGTDVKVQIAIDTGMNRIGLNADDAELCSTAIREYADKLNVKGIFTHLCIADTKNEDAFTNEQINKFNHIAESIKDLNLPYIHCLNSAGGAWHKGHGNLVRLGIMLYGLKPDYANIMPGGIKPILEWKSIISMIKDVFPSETIGYGRSFKVTEKMRIATVPTGYADGYCRSLSNKGSVIVRGKKAPIVGKICMDQMMIDVTNIPEAAFMDEVHLLCPEYTADDMAHDAGTIGYEVVCGISKRVPRIYLNGGE